MPPRMTAPADRFWPKVDKSGDCWPWTGTRLPKGYGQFGRGRRGAGMAKAHRISWELHYGPIPEGLCVLHHCDNPPCVRPDHLFLGTQSDNLADMTAKGRRVRHGAAGEANVKARLTWDEVRAIRASAGETGNQLAARYGVTRGEIYNVRSMRTWRDS